MANTLVITQEQALNRATIMLGQMTNARLRLVTTIIPAANTNRTVLLANECNFTGYPAGGYNVGTPLGPSSLPTGGAAITLPTVLVQPNIANVTPNNVTGWWLEQPNLSGTLNVTLLAGQITPGITVTVPTDAFPLSIQDFEGLPIAVTPG